MEKRSTVDQIEVQRNGMIQVRIAKEIVDADGRVVSQDWHRTSLPPGTDIEAHMAAVNAHLTEFVLWPAVSAADVARIGAVAAALWTPETIAAYAATTGLPGQGG